MLKVTYAFQGVREAGRSSSCPRRKAPPTSPIVSAKIFSFKLIGLAVMLFNILSLSSLLGTTVVPRWTAQLRITWAGCASTFCAIVLIVSFSIKVLNRPSENKELKAEY